MSRKFRVLRPDGQPVTNVDVETNWYRPTEQDGSSSSRRLDGDGVMDFAFGSTGLWHMKVRFRDTPLSTIPIRQAPYYAGEATVAVSNLATRSEAVDLRSIVHQPGSIDVQLLDVHGKPARGSVLLGDPSFPVTHAASTDESGRVTFAGVFAWTQTIRGYLPGTRPPDLRPDVDVSTLTATLVVPSTQVDLRTTATAKVVLRQVRAGYVYGTLRPSAGEKPSDSSFYFHRSFERVETPRSPMTARPGRSSSDRCCRGGRGDRPTGTAGAQACLPGPSRPRSNRAGPCTPDFSPMPPAEQRDFYTEAWKTVAGSVLLADGKTPAYAARVLKFIPDDINPGSGAWTDATGRFVTHSMSIPMGQPGQERNPKGGPPTPVLVGLAAWPVRGGDHPAREGVGQANPGRVAAADQPDWPGHHRRQEPARISAAPAVDQPGQPGELNVHILAAHQGAGKLDGLLSVSTYADPDGRFGLHGLTPGKYIVQAAIDDIWLSQSVELTIKPGRRCPGADRAEDRSARRNGHRSLARRRQTAGRRGCDGRSPARAVDERPAASQSVPPTAMASW